MQHISSWGKENFIHFHENDSSSLQCWEDSTSEIYIMAIYILRKGIANSLATGSQAQLVLKTVQSNVKVLQQLVRTLQQKDISSIFSEI